MLPVLIYGAVCLGIGWLGSRHKFGFWGYFFCSLIFTPLTGIIAVLAGTDQRTIRKPADADERTALSELQAISALVDDPSHLPEDKIRALRYRLDVVLPMLKAPVLR